MERDQVIVEDAQTQQFSPSRYRLKWDEQGLVLEERNGSGEYINIDESGISVPPNPVAAIHPDLEVVIDKTVEQYGTKWLNDTDGVDIALSPPWGSSWLIDLDGIPEEEIENQVSWELQQRLDCPLDDCIYAWQPFGGQAYAIIIRPELLEFWDKIFSNHKIALKSITILSDLVSDSIAQSANLLPLLRLWHDKRQASGAQFGNISFPGDDLGIDASDEDLKAIFGTAKKKKRKAKIPKKPLIVGVSATIVLVVYLLFKATIFSFIGSTSEKIANLFDKDDQTEQVAVGDSAETSQLIDDNEPVVLSGPSTGELLEIFYNSADETNTDITYLILQDNLVRCEVAGDDQDIAEWSQKISNYDENSVLNIVEPVQLAMGSILKIELEQSRESSMTEEQFSELARSLGISNHGSHAYRCDRAGLMRLFGVLKGEANRLFRLSIQHRTRDDYLLVMFP